MSSRSTVSQIHQMLELQHNMNLKIHPQWFKQDYEWYRAIWVECAEMLDHFGWKWWKKQTPDTEQVMLELVDIFHFGLSSRIDGKTQFDQIARTLADELGAPQKQGSFCETLELLAGNAITRKVFDAQAFAGCMEQIELSFDQLYRAYIGKNTLNLFRQDHGYKSGSYIKVWHGREDNEVLMDIIHKLDSEAADFADLVYQGLSKKYPG